MENSRLFTGGGTRCSAAYRLSGQALKFRM
jgi:hypothetical protein